MKYTLNNDNFEVVGKQYLQGVGGYDGTNPTESDDLAKIIKENTEANLSKLTDSYWAEQDFLEQPVDPHFRTPVVFYYTPDGVSSLPSEVEPIEIWRCNRLMALSEASIYVKMQGTTTVSGTDAAYLPASLVSDQNGIFLIWEDNKNRYELLIDYVNTQPKITLKSDSAIISITYSELVSLRDSSKLIPGQQYRITDYVTTTTQSDTQSAGHQFDIIVTADDVNVLNENARAIQHEGDTYFTEVGANFSAWQIWYSLDNDVERFDWADAENGKGVIYHMIDEFGNDCPYDFKNILFKRYKTTSNHEAFKDDKTPIEDYLGIKNPGGADLTMPSLFTIPSESDYTWYYTFNSLSGTEDITLSNNEVRLNKIERGLNYNTKKPSLNNIVLRTNGALKRHTFADDCFNTTITTQNGQQNNWDNFFGQYCRGNVIVVNGAHAQNNFNCNFHTNCIVITNDGGLNCNKFDGYAQNNIIKTNVFAYNNINASFKWNQIYGGFGENTIGLNATGNTISADFGYNQISNFFVDNTINGAMFKNVIGESFKSNTINDSSSGGFRQTTIGVSATGNTLTGILNCNIGQLFIDNNISYMTASKIGAGFRNNCFKQDALLSSADRPYVQGCTFGDYVWFNNFYNTTTAAENTPIACFRVQSYLQGRNATNPNHIQIPLSPYKSEITVAKTSDGVIKVYIATN